MGSKHQQDGYGNEGTSTQGQATRGNTGKNKSVIQQQSTPSARSDISRHSHKIVLNTQCKNFME